MNTDIKLPAIPEPLIRILDKKFPERCPNPNDPEREVWIKAGERKMVRFLIEQYNRQQEVVMEN